MPDEAEFSAKFIAVFLKQFYKDIHIFKVFKCINSKIVCQKNNKDRECQVITEVPGFKKVIER